MPNPNDPNGGDWPEIIDDTESASDAPVPQRGAPLSYSTLGYGRLPVIPNPGIPLYPHEVVHAIFEDVAVYQRQIVGQTYVGGSAGITLFSGDMAFSFGQSAGRASNQWRDVRLAHGHLVLTSQRLILWAGEGGFHLLWQQILNCSVVDGGVALSPSTSAPGEPPIVLSVWDPQALFEWVSVCWSRGIETGR